MPVAAEEATASTHNHDDPSDVTWTPVKNSTELKKITSGYYYLTDDITLMKHTKGDYGWRLPNNAEIHLCLNGHMIQYTGTTGGSVIVVGGSGITNSVLNLYDCDEGTTSHTVQNSHVYGTDGQLIELKTYYGGLITGGYRGYIVQSSPKVLYGGGGVCVLSNGHFIMHGGTIAQNDGDYGGGVYVGGALKSTFTMKGGTICDNYAPEGGGVQVVKLSTFTMEDGTITTNSGGVIQGEEASLSGVYILPSTSRVAFIMTGGTIKDNERNGNKGDLRLNKGHAEIYGDAKIDGHTSIAGTSGGALTISGNAVISGTIDSGTSAQNSITISGSPTVPNATGSGTVNSNDSSYTVTWVDDNGAVLETDTNVYYGITPSYDSATPTKAATDEYTYTFNGWSPAVSKVTGHVTYTATYTATKNTYTVTWKNEDGTELKVEKIEYGKTPNYGENPTKAATAEFTYTFKGWTPEVSTVTGEVTYTAQYEATKNKYTITWVDEDGTELEKDEGVEYGTMPTYNSAEPTKAATAEFTYTFKGWNPTVSTVTGDITYTVQYEATKNKYTITWVDEDGTELEKDESVEYGTMPTYNSAEPTKAATAEYTYTFAGWNPTVSTVTGEVTYTAQYDATTNKYTVTWKNEDGTVLETDEGVTYGTMPTYDSATPTKAATAEYTYTFAGWNAEVSAVTGHVTYTAQYNAVKNTYTVTWVNADGSLLEKDESVEYGTMPTYDSATPTKAANAQYTYTFAGWNAEVSPVTGHVTYKATYTETINTYTVTWKNEDGTVLETDEGVTYGTMPTYDKAEPTKDATAQYTYTFAGWNPTVSTVTGNVAYTAQYDATTNKYTVTWVNEDGTELEKDEGVAYGTKPKYDSATPTKAADHWYTYTFAGWNTQVSEVTGDVTYTATYNEEPITYTITLNANHDANCGHSSEATITLNGETTPVTYKDNIYPPTYQSYPGNKGYTLLGWFTADGVEVINVDGNLLENVPGYIENGNWIGTDAELWAQWKANETEITLDANGGTFGTDDAATTTTIITATYLQLLPSFTKPTKTHEGTGVNCHVAGWYTAPTGGTKVLDSEGKLRTGIGGYSNNAGQWTNESASVTLYAQWNHYETPYYVDTYKESLITGEYDVTREEYRGYVDEKVTYTPSSDYTGFTFDDTQNNKLSGTVSGDENNRLVLSLYYKRDSYTVTLGAGEGVESVTLGDVSAATVTDTYKYEQPVTISMTFKEGYEFYHWHISEGNPATDISTNPDTFTMPAHDVTYTAHALPIEYTITYELDGGENNNANVGTYTIEKIVTLYKASKPDHTFVGWYLDPEFTKPTTGWEPGQEIGNVIVYAKWKPNTIPYTVQHYKAEIGGYTVADELTLTGNIDTEVTATPNAYSGYIYNEVISRPTGTLEEGTNVVLELYYDQFSTITLNANHDADCGHSSTANITFNGDTTTVKYGNGAESVYPPQYSDNHQHNGYTLLGWYTAPTGGDKVIDVDGTLMANVPGYMKNGVWIGKNANLWAQWQAKATIITLDANGDGDETGITPGDNSVTATYAQPLPAFTAPSKIHDGDPNRKCLLAGWYTETNGGGTKILKSDGTLIADLNGYSNHDGQWINESPTLTLYAHWNHDPILYTVNIHKETLTDGIYEEDIYEYRGYVDQQITYKLEEYTGFTYESDKSTNTGTVKADGSLVLDLYYKRNSYEITLSTGTGNGVESVTLGDASSEETVTNTYKYHQSVTISMNPKEGYEFFHWDISEDVASTNKDFSKNPATFEMPAEKVSLIAHANPIPYDLIYELDGGLNHRTNSGKYTIEYPVDLLPASKTGFHFDGWYLDAAFTEPTTGWDAGEMTGPVTVYAKWIIAYPLTDDSTLVIEQGDAAIFISTADYNKFIAVLIDGTEIDGSNYEVTEGSTIVTLKENYVQTLSVGEHSIIIRSDDGEAQTTFTVTESSGTPVAPPSPSSGSQGSSVWLTETPTPTPTTTPTGPELAPTDIPTNIPLPTEATSPVSLAAVLAGLGAALVLRRR